MAYGVKRIERLEPQHKNGGEGMPEKKNEKEKTKKQLLLRLSPTLWNDLAEWAEDDFRSINGQIEYLLTEAVRKRKKGKKGEQE